VRGLFRRSRGEGLLVMLLKYTVGRGSLGRIIKWSVMGRRTICIAGKQRSSNRAEQTITWVPKTIRRNPTRHNRWREAMHGDKHKEQHRQGEVHRYIGKRAPKGELRSTEHGLKISWTTPMYVRLHARSPPDYTGPFTSRDARRTPPATTANTRLKIEPRRPRTEWHMKTTRSMSDAIKPGEKTHEARIRHQMTESQPRAGPRATTDCTNAARRRPTCGAPTEGPREPRAPTNHRHRLEETKSRRQTTRRTTERGTNAITGQRPHKSPRGETTTPGEDTNNQQTRAKTTDKEETRERRGEEPQHRDKTNHAADNAQTTGSTRDQSQNTGGENEASERERPGRPTEDEQPQWASKAKQRTKSSAAHTSAQTRDTNVRRSAEIRRCRETHNKAHKPAHTRKTMRRPKHEGREVQHGTLASTERGRRERT